MSANFGWIFLTAIRREPYFQGEQKLSKVGFQIARIVWLEETANGTKIVLDDGREVEVVERIEEIACAMARPKRHGL